MGFELQKPSFVSVHLSMRLTAIRQRKRYYFPSFSPSLSHRRCTRSTRTCAGRAPQTFWSLETRHASRLNRRTNANIKDRPCGITTKRRTYITRLRTLLFIDIFHLGFDLKIILCYAYRSPIVKIIHRKFFSPNAIIGDLVEFVPLTSSLLPAFVIIFSGIIFSDSLLSSKLSFGYSIH